MFVSYADLSNIVKKFGEICFAFIRDRGLFLEPFTMKAHFVLFTSCLSGRPLFFYISDNGLGLDGEHSEAGLRGLRSAPRLQQGVEKQKAAPQSGPCELFVFYGERLTFSHATAIPMRPIQCRAESVMWALGQCWILDMPRCPYRQHLEFPRSGYYWRL